MPAAPSSLAPVKPSSPSSTKNDSTWSGWTCPFGAGAPCSATHLGDRDRLDVAEQYLALAAALEHELLGADRDLARRQQALDALVVVLVEGERLLVADRRACRG